MRCEKLLLLNKTLPNAIFSRKPRSLHFVDKWKATEFRQFLLYTGPFALKGELPNDQYKHFLLFHVAIRRFVEDFDLFYGDNSITYNVHNLIHLTDDEKINGPLDNFSAFPYENFMKDIKICVNSSNFQLQQNVSLGTFLRADIERF
ncbi:hypothetical protein PPYR_01600 [Photinus pyralis]|uniref:Uncharacterized protein n=1 Tax=Photinus pyralis TaxID=7054 RepID=A0A5N4B5J7_PHOPY|nr:hypothetical protein PPYR_01600 [Photinus pyralis]